MDNQLPTTSHGKAAIIKNIYFYLVSFVALMMVVWSTADLINIALKTWVFTKADNYFYGEPYLPGCDGSDASMTAKPALPPGERPATTTPEQCEKMKQDAADREQKSKLARNQNNIVRDLSMIMVGIPLFLYHWRIVRRKDENL